MAIDVRAKIHCSLGSLIKASISDDYLQGSGLIKTSGSCELNGLVYPPVGTPVTFQYTKKGITRTLPRKLRVLSSFADPYRRVTTVELGCKLTYLQDKKDSIKWTAEDDPAHTGITSIKSTTTSSNNGSFANVNFTGNATALYSSSSPSDYDDEDLRIITVPIYASSVMAKCLDELGIQARRIPLTNSFSIAEFDFSPGYVAVLSDLLVSESYVGYLDLDEMLQVVSMDDDGGTGPVLDASKIIDLGPIGVGQLPGEAVVVNYNTLVLRNSSEAPPDEPPDQPGTPEDFDPWTRTSAHSFSTVNVAYEDADGNGQYETFQVSEDVTEVSEYKIIGGNNVLSSRTTTEVRSSALVGGSLIPLYLKYRGQWPSFQVKKTKIETFEYDGQGRQTRSVSDEYGDFLYGAGSLDINYAFANGALLIDPAMDLQCYLGGSVVETIRQGIFEKQIEYTYGPWGRTIAGQQAVAESRDAFQAGDAAEAKARTEDFIAAALTGRSLLDTNISVRDVTSDGQRAPLPADQRNQRAAAASGNPALNFRTESTSRIELVSGAREAQRRIEFTMPYAPDDVFVKGQTFGSTFSPLPLYWSKASDAPAKANRFGRVQNRLLLGNRNGISVQAEPENIPQQPFSPFFIVAEGLTAMYRTNALSWVLDSSGIIASTDALYWGIAGKD